MTQVRTRCARPRRSRGGPQLTWAVVDGTIRSVEDFAHLPPERRPAASCPVCCSAVTFKLGEQLAHHVAHDPGAECVATGGESALHLNAKFHVARELERAKQLRVVAKCEWCDGVETYTWAEHWTQIVVERGLGSVRPDISILSGDTTIGAIEIFVTHAVGEEKAQRLDELKIPWLEVEAHEDLLKGPTKWRAPAPLMARRMGSDKSGLCAPCKRQGCEEDERDSHDRIVERCVIDVYGNDGKHRREEYLQWERIRHGASVQSWIAGPDWVSPSHNGPRSEDAEHRLDRSLRRHLRERGDMLSARVELRSPWTPVPIDGFPRQRYWDDTKQRWIKKRSTKTSQD